MPSLSWSIARLAHLPPGPLGPQDADQAGPKSNHLTQVGMRARRNRPASNLPPPFSAGAPLGPGQAREEERVWRSTRHHRARHEAAGLVLMLSQSLSHRVGGRWAVARPCLSTVWEWTSHMRASWVGIGPANERTVRPAYLPNNHQDLQVITTNDNPAMPRAGGGGGGVQRGMIIWRGHPTTAWEAPWVSCGVTKQRRPRS